MSNPDFEKVWHRNALSMKISKMLFARGHENGAEDPNKLYEYEIDTGLANMISALPELEGQILPGYTRFMKERFNDAVVKQGTGAEEKKWIDVNNFQLAFSDCFLGDPAETCWKEYTSLIE